MHAHEAAYLWLIPFFPMLGAVVNGLFGYPLQKKLGRRPVSLIACASVFASFALSVYAFWQLLGTEPRLLGCELWTWFRIGELDIDFAFMVDPLTAVM
ncbi:MAG: NADH-quinone oxidoreductase subunit L, partial [Candidatus Krumholzibacteriia bacterium]